MKKSFLATASLVALMGINPATAADPMKLQITGSLRAMTGWYGFDAAAANRGYGVATPNAEIQFSASGKSDNGMSYGVVIESAGNTGSTDANASGALNSLGSPDEAYMYATSDWGRVELGAQDGAANRMEISGANALVATKSLSGGLGSRQFWSTGGTDTGVGTGAPGQNLDRYDSLNTQSGDDPKIIYFSPRFSGFQAGVSMSPTGNGATNQSKGANTETTVENIAEVGLNYVGEFNGAKVTVAGTYTRGDTANNATVEKLSVYNVGALVQIAGISVGAGYLNMGDSLVRTTTGADAGKVWNIGVGYTSGPWGVSAGFQRGTKDLNATQDATVDHLVLGAQYAVAPGWTAMLEYNTVDISDERNPAAQLDRSSLVFTNQFSF
jgi:outer membrane protein OmpU